MNKWFAIVIILQLMMFSLAAHAEDWHCITTISQTSVDYKGKAIRSTCMPSDPQDAAKVAEEKKNCERGSRKNKAKAWLKGACPTKNRIGTCTITKMGPATLPQPKIVHTYEEHGGNLTLEDEVSLAYHQCAKMSLNSGKFVDVSNEFSSTAKASDSSKDAASKPTVENDSALESAQEQNNKQESVGSKTTQGVKKAWGSFKDAISKSK